MANSNPLTRAIDRLVDAAAPGSDDAELLRRHRETGDAKAFECIVRRHGGTVLGVCRRILNDPHAADDAFQATFLQLVRKSRTLNSPGALPAWLYVTARRIALRHRRRDPARQVAEPPASTRDPLDVLSARELLAAIEDEIARLPQRYQLPLILCYLDGLSKREAAERLGLSADVLRGRLDRGRERLRSALVRRGFAPAAALGLLALVASPVSAELIRRTVGVCACGEPIPAAVALLAAGGQGFLTKTGLVAGVLMLVGLGLLASAGHRDPAPQPKAEPVPAAAAPARRDLHGDPLPPHAVARMGSLRWRHADDFRPHLDVVPSPTGELVATVSRGGQDRPPAASGKGMVRVWALPGGRQVCQFPWDDAAPAWNLDFAPDGARLMILTPRGAVKFHDPRTGELLAESKPILEKSGEGVVTRDGRWVVTRANRKLTLTEIVTDPAALPRKVELDMPPGSFSLRSGGLACDGNHLIGYTHDKASGWQPLVLRWDVRTGQLSHKAVIPTKNMVVASSLDGKRVATWRYDVPPSDVLQVWDTETGKEVVALEGAQRRGYGTIQLSPDGKRLIAAVKPGEPAQTAIVWELDHGKVVARVDLPGWCNRFFLLPDGKTLLASSFPGIMFGTWDLATGRRLSPVTGHESSVQHLAFTRDGTTLLTSSTDADEGVAAWDAATGRKLRDLTPTATIGQRDFFAGRMAPFVWTPGGAVVTTDKGMLVWKDEKTGRELRRVTPEPITAALHPGDCFLLEKLSLAHDPETGRPAVLAFHEFGVSPVVSEPKRGWTEVITLWDAETGGLLGHRTLPRSRYGLDDAVVSPDGRLVARADHGPAPGVPADRGQFVFWVEVSAALGGPGAFRLPPPGDESGPRLFTSDGQTLITATKRKRRPKGDKDAAVTVAVQLWEVRSGKMRLEFPLPFEPTALAVSPDGRFLATERSDTKTIVLLDLTKGDDVARRDGYRSLVQTLAFRADGKSLASGHADGTALVWDLSNLPGMASAGFDREAAWTDLASADARKAHRAILALAADPDGVALLRGKVKPAAGVPARRIRELVKDLDNEAYAIRQAATKALKELGDAAHAELRTRLRADLSAEQRRRIAGVLDEDRELLESDPERLRALRCVEVLERAGSAEARALLGELAKGAAGVRLTIEAAQAVWRLSTRS